MKKALFAVFVGMWCVAIFAYRPMPAWDRVEGKPVSFFQGNGFEFAVDDSVGHHYEKPTVEISLIVPPQFTNEKVKYEFYSVLLLNKEISADLDSHPHDKKKRILLTISEKMARTSQIIFYYKNSTETASEGTMFVLDLSKVLDHLKKNEKMPNNALLRTSLRAAAEG